jgi:aminomethyltransferase
VVADLAGLKQSHSTLSLFTNENGGIIDDTVINKKSDSEYYIVSNAGCAEKDLNHFKQQLMRFNSNGGDCSIEQLDGLSLVAIQGIFRFI